MRAGMTRKQDKVPKMCGSESTVTSGTNRGICRWSLINESCTVPISVRGNNLKSKDDAPLVPYREVAMPIDAAISVTMPTATNSARVLTGQLLSA
jgi:hypothetical protein